eukprot:COSAG01_NODE_30660_length_611_cov_5.212891_1_plen_34_part_10
MGDEHGLTWDARCRARRRQQMQQKAFRSTGTTLV